MKWLPLMRAAVDEPVKLDVGAAYRIINGEAINGAFVKVKTVYLAKDEKGLLILDEKTGEPKTVTIDDLIVSIEVSIQVDEVSIQVDEAHDDRQADSHGA